MKDKVYTNGEVSIVWKPGLCMHSTNCVHGLPEVFDNTKRPWVNAEGAATDQIIEQVNKCPSGALSYFMNKEEGKMEDITKKAELNLAKDGPILIKGEFTITDSKGNAVDCGEQAALCRCGGSANKPFCDGAHNSNGFHE